jgi:hypothetical protein
MQTTRRRALVVRTSLAKLIAQLYAQASPATRARLLANLLRPVGPLALVAIAAGAFARLLPHTRWHGAELSLDDAARIGPHQIVELVRYVEQKSPEVLWQLPQLVGDTRLWAGTVAGTLLLLALRRRRNAIGAAAVAAQPLPPAATMVGAPSHA